MEEAAFLFFRGSTPTLELVLPLAVEPEDTVYLTLAQGGRPVLEYTLNGSPEHAGSGVLRRAEDEKNLLLLTMSQSDTLALESGDTELQLRLKNAVGADTFQPLRGCVGPARKEGLI